MRNKSVFLAVYTENAKLPAGKINRFASIRNKEFVLLVASWYFFLIIFFLLAPDCSYTLFVVPSGYYWILEYLVSHLALQKHRKIGFG